MYLVYREDGITRKISFNSILHLETKINYSLVHLEDRCITVPIPLWELEKSLPESKFARINKSSIVNIQKIVDENPKEILLLGGHKLKPGKAFKEWLGTEK